MGQVPHVDTTDTPADIAAGLEPGCYLAQAVGGSDSLGVLYATSAQPPTSDADYFHCRGYHFFSFIAGNDQPPTWVKSAVPGVPLSVALAVL